MTIAEFPINGFSSSKSFINSMPEVNTRLTQFVAEVNFLAVINRWKINQPDFQVFDQAATILDLLASVAQLFLAMTLALLQIGDTLLIYAHATRPHNLLGDLLQILFRTLHPASERERLTQQLLDPWKHLLSFLKSKKTRHPT